GYPHLKGPLSSASAVRFLDVMDDADLWESLAPGTGTWSVVSSADATTGGTVLRAVGSVNLRSRVRIPHDPDVLYRVSVRVRTLTEGSGVPTVFLGLYGLAADGVTTVNRDGVASIGNQAYACAVFQSLPSASGWVTYTGYVRGRAAAGVSGGAGPNPLMTSPLTLHGNVRFVAPYARLDFANPSVTGSTVEIDRVSVDAVYPGLLTAEAIAAGAIDGQTITGATVRTAAGFPRIELAPDGNLYFYPAAGVDPGLIAVEADGVLHLVGPNGDGVEYGVTFQKAFGTSSATFSTDEVTAVGSLYADNYRSGRVTITPSAANVPTSVTVTGIGMSGSGPVRAYASPITTVPGTEVRGVSCTSPSRDSVVVWVTRTNTTSTGIDWHLIGER
ncbi:hypothetical protein ACIPQA_33730, partial [Streptomyces sp. NPDC090109]|uniref:hypothetical protein n=1 Tax=Streptomyces sp. NPDC090109 TaxID=3365948 RepID=UPI003816F08B